MKYVMAFWLAMVLTLTTMQVMAGSNICDVDSVAACSRTESVVENHIANHPESTVTNVQQTKLIEFEPEYTGFYLGFRS